MPLWLFDANFQWVLTGTFLLGLSSGALGSFALLRRRSLMGDVLAHAALPGIVAAFLWSGTKSMNVLLIGAAVAGIAGTGTVNLLTRHSRMKEDTALASVLTVFYGIGIVLLTVAAKTGGDQSGLDSFILGKAASLIRSDVHLIAAVSISLLLVLTLGFHEFKLICFHPEYARSIGRPVEWIDNLLMAMIVVAVVVGLKAVGVILMAAMLILPAISARYWTDRLATMVILSGLFGGAAGAVGTFLSSLAPQLSTGPVIVWSAATVFLFSIVFAPGKGALSRWLRVLRVRSRVRRENLLRRLFELQELALRAHPDVPNPWVPLNDLVVRRSDSPERLRRDLEKLATQGLIELETGSGEQGGTPRCRFTESGLREAYAIVWRHRLWEMYLMHEADIAADHVHRDADLLEHHLPEHVMDELKRLLRIHGREPVLPESVHPIPRHGRRGS